MMNKIIRILGIKGRITIPFVTRKLMGLTRGDILSFALSDNQIIIKKEKLCDNCENQEWDEKEFNMFLDTLSPHETAYMLKWLTQRLCTDKSTIRGSDGC